MTTHIEVMREALEAAAQDCPDCGNHGSWLDGQEWMQCEFCYTVPNSRFNIDRALSAHEAEIEKREQEMGELIGALVGVKACAEIDGRPEWLTVAEHIDATLTKVKP